MKNNSGLYYETFPWLRITDNSKKNIYIIVSCRIEGLLGVLSTLYYAHVLFLNREGFGKSRGFGKENIMGKIERRKNIRRIWKKEITLYIKYEERLKF